MPLSVDAAFCMLRLRFLMRTPFLFCTGFPFQYQVTLGRGWPWNWHLKLTSSSCFLRRMAGDRSTGSGGTKRCRMNGKSLNFAAVSIHSTVQDLSGITVHIRETSDYFTCDAKSSINTFLWIITNLTVVPASVRQLYLTDLQVTLTYDLETAFNWYWRAIWWEEWKWQVHKHYSTITLCRSNAQPTYPLWSRQYEAVVLLLPDIQRLLSCQLPPPGPEAQPKIWLAWLCCL